MENIGYFDTNNDIDKIMNIWLKSNLEAHPFVKASYWENNFKIVKEMISNSEIYVYKIDSIIVGFVGLSQNYIAGIFIEKEYRNQKIGFKLLQYIKNIKDELILSVYEKNIKAYNFYIKNGFILKYKSLDKENNEIEYTLIWKK